MLKFMQKAVALCSQVDHSPSLQQVCLVEKHKSYIFLLLLHIFLKFVRDFKKGGRKGAKVAKQTPKVIQLIPDYR